MKPGAKISEPKIIITPDSARRGTVVKEPTTLELGKSPGSPNEHHENSLDSGRAVSQEF